MEPEETDVEGIELDLNEMNLGDELDGDFIWELAVFNK